MSVLAGNRRRPLSLVRHHERYHCAAAPVAGGSGQSIIVTRVRRHLCSGRGQRRMGSAFTDHVDFENVATIGVYPRGREWLVTPTAMRHVVVGHESPSSSTTVPLMW